MRFTLLPVGLVAAISLSLLFPEPGRALEALRIGPAAPIHLLIAIIFLVSGWSLNPAEPLRWQKIAPAAIAALLLHFMLWPLLAWTFIGIFSVSWAFGLIVTAIVPTTLSSAIVITRQAGGSPWLSILLTLLLSFAGVFASPLLLKLLITEVEGGLPVGSLILTLISTVAVPLALGWTIRKISEPPWLRHLPTLCIIAAVWLSTSRHQTDLVSLDLISLLAMTSSATGLHLLMTSVAWMAGRILRLQRPERISLAIVGGQKTLPFSLALLGSLSVGNEAEHLIALAIAFCVIFHFCQILIDSIWAEYWRVR